MFNQSRRSEQKQVEEFVRLTKPYQARLYRLAVSFCHDRDHGADLLQEALIKAFNSWDKFQKDAPVFPWLARILRNTFLDSLKTGQARHEITAAALPDEDWDASFKADTSAADPHTILESTELRQQLQEELDTLDENHKTLIILCDIEGVNYDEAAEIMGIPVGTVRSRLSRSRAYLRQRLRNRLSLGLKDE